MRLSGKKTTYLRLRHAGAGSLCLFFLCLVFFGCSSSRVPEPQDQRIVQGRRLIWPPAPETARIAFVQTISVPEDIGANKGFFKRIFEFILGSEGNAVLKPYGVAVDSSGRLIVADTAYKRIHIYDLKAPGYDYIDSAGDAKLESPIGVAADADGNIYVTDPGARKVFAYRKNGQFLFEFDAGVKPTGIAVNRVDKEIYVVDTGTHNVGVYDLNGNRKRSFGVWGAKGGGEFNFPVDIFIDKSGDVYVTDSMNYKIKIFDKTGRFITMFGRHGDGTGDFGRPKGVATDREGNIYVADSIFDTVQIFDRNGRFLLSFGSIGNENGSFWMPCGIFIDVNDRIYVADSYNRRIQVFEYLGNL